MKLAHLTFRCPQVFVLIGCVGAQVPPPGTEQARVIASAQENPTEPQPTATGANAWFEATRIDLGTQPEGHAEAIGHFQFRNPRQEVHRLSGFVSSCTCAEAEIVVGQRRYHFDNEKKLRLVAAVDGEPWTPATEVEIAPGEVGEVVLTMDMQHHRGVREASLRFSSSDAAQGNVALTLRSTVPMFRDPGGNDWFDATYKDLGVYFEGEDATGTFKFKNTRDKAHFFRNFIGSCTCTKADIRIGDRLYNYGSDKILRRITIENGVESKANVDHVNIEPGEEGEISVHMNMVGVRGPRSADLQFQTSDGDYPVINLKWQATGSQLFVVTPEDIHLNEMTWQDKREFQFEVTSPVREDFNLLGHDALPAHMEIEYNKGQRDGRTVWFVKGAYGPGVDERAGGGTINFQTDVDDHKVTARVIATIKGPLQMEPGGFVSFGHVKLGTGKEQVVTITPTDDFDLQVTELEVAKLGVKAEDRKYVEFSHHKEGKAVKIVLKILDGMPKSYVNGILKVHLNHPSNSEKEIMFNGFVR